MTTIARPLRNATLLLVVAGCSLDSEGQEPDVGAVGQPIYNAGDGMAVDDAHAHPQVFTVQSPIWRGTGSLVASNVVLTAAHVTATSLTPGDPYVLATGTHWAELAENAPPHLVDDLIHLVSVFPQRQ